MFSQSITGLPHAEIMSPRHLRFRMHWGTRACPPPPAVMHSDQPGLFLLATVDNLTCQLEFILFDFLQACTTTSCGATSTPSMACHGPSCRPRGRTSDSASSITPAPVPGCCQCASTFDPAEPWLFCLPDCSAATGNVLCPPAATLWHQSWCLNACSRYHRCCLLAACRSPVSRQCVLQWRFRD